jgi:hypothetical protein
MILFAAHCPSFPRQVVLYSHWQVSQGSFKKHGQSLKVVKFCGKSIYNFVPWSYHSTCLNNLVGYICVTFPTFPNNETLTVARGRELYVAVLKCP